MRYMVGALVIAGIGYWGYSSWQDHVEFEQKRIAREAKRETLKSAVSQMASIANAVTDWPAHLASEKRTRRTPVLTAELQRLWVLERPILFLGNLEDVVINPDGTYRVIVQHNWLDSKYKFVGNTIRVALDCPESVAAPLLNAAKVQRRMILGSDTAITGQIQRIVTTSHTDAEGDTTTVLTGFGKCFSGMHLDERISW